MSATPASTVMDSTYVTVHLRTGHAGVVTVTLTATPVVSSAATVSAQAIDATAGKVDAAGVSAHQKQQQRDDTHVGVIAPSTTASELRDPPGRYQALCILATAMVLSMSTWFSASAVIKQLLVIYDVDAAAGSSLTIAVQLGFVAGALLSAALTIADIIPPRMQMLLGSCLAAVCNAVLAVGAPLGFAGAVVMRALTGFALAYVYPPGMKAISQWFRVQRGMALGVMVGALTVGSAVPHLINALGGAQWRVVVWGTSILTVVGGLIAQYLGRDGPYPFNKSVFDPRQVPLLLRNRPVLLSTVGYLGHSWELYAMWTWYAGFIGDRLAQTGGYNDAQATTTGSLITFFVVAIGSVGAYLGGVVSDRVGRCITTATMLIISGTCSASIGVISEVAPLAVTIIVSLVWGVTVIGDSAQFSAVVIESADQSYVGTALSVQLASGFALTSVSIFLIPVLQAFVGYQWVFATLALGPVCGAAAMLHLRRLPEARKIAGGRR